MSSSSISLLPKRLGPRARFAARAALLMIGLYLAIYFPYPQGSFPARALDWYVGLQALVSGATLRLFDATVSVAGADIGGRFPLRIVLDCTALDAMALFAAAVLAFPAPVRVKLAGLGGGVAVLALVNLGRIFFLYFAGVRWPASFDLFHEDIMQLALILVAVGCFAAYAAWSRPARTQATPTGGDSDAGSAPTAQLS